MATPGPRLRVLFLCTGNSCRSQMAEGFARFHGGYQVEALSAGSRPSGQINPKAIRFMEELGYDLTTHASTSLDDITGTFDAVITMGCGDACPFFPGKTYLDWPLNDPAGKGVEEVRPIRDEIRAKVEALIAEIDAKF